MAGFAGFREGGCFGYSQGYGRQRLDADSGLAGLQGIPARAGRTGQAIETVGAAEAGQQAVGVLRVWQAGERHRGEL